MDTKKVFRRISNKMLEDFDISAEIKHQGSKGTYRENSLKKFLSEGRLPLRYGIGTGEIVGPAHNVSRQSDLVIYDRLNGISLIYDESTQVFPIECVAGTIEVKSTLNKTEFMESLENIKSVKKLAPRESVTRSISGLLTMRYQRPTPFGAVFGYRLGRNSLSSLIDNLQHWEKSTPKEYWPNVIAVLGEGLIHHYKNGLEVAYTNSDLREAGFPSSIHYKSDSLFKFYSALMDLCTSTDLGPVVLSRYFDRAEQLGEYTVSNHDRILKKGRDEVFKLSEAFVSKVVTYCHKEGGMSHEQLLMRRFGQIPVGLDDRQLNAKVFLYNPDQLKGIHEVENAITVHDGMAVAAEGVLEPCHCIIVNGETFYIPWVYVTDNEIEEIPGRATSDL